MNKIDKTFMINLEKEIQKELRKAILFRKDSFNVLSSFLIDPFIPFSPEDISDYFPFQKIRKFFKFDQRLLSNPDQSSNENDLETIISNDDIQNLLEKINMDNFNIDTVLKTNNGVGDKCYQSLIEIAAQNNSKECFNLLICLNPKLGRRLHCYLNECGVMEYSVETGQIDFLKKIIELGQKPNLLTLKFAAMCHENMILSWILKFGIEDLFLSIKACVKSNNIEGLIILLETRPKFKEYEKKISELLQLALEKKNFIIWNILFKYGLNTNSLLNKFWLFKKELKH